MTRVGLDPNALEAAFPFHFALDRELKLLQAGRALLELCPAVEEGARLDGCIELVMPDLPFGYDELLARRGSLIVLRFEPPGLTLRGQVFEFGDGSLLFAGAPWLADPSEVKRLGITLSAFAPHDPTPEFLFLRQAHDSAADDARDLLSRLEVEVGERARLEQTERALEHELNASVDFWMRLDRSGKVLELRVSPTLRVFDRYYRELIGHPLPLGLGGIRTALERLGTFLSTERTHRFECTLEGDRLYHFDCRATAMQSDEVLVVGRDVTERRRLEDQLRHQALHDALTGLPNRTLLHERLARALRTMIARPTDRELALLFIDLDDFKTINDVLGHSVGDGLLIQVARRLESNLRPNDTAARLGGDEFAVILEGLTHAGHALEIAHRLRERVTARLTLQGTEIRPLCSIGIAVTDGADSPEELFRQADLAMYRAKEAGAGGVDLFDDELRRKVTERLERKREIEPALTDDQFVLHYQPVVDLADFGLTGLEALVRWQHPKHGLLGPFAFIDLAEESGLIIPMGRRILEMACHQAAEWREIPAGEHLRLAVNLSAKQLACRDLVSDVAAILKSSGLPAGALTLEITESHVVHDVDDVIQVLEQLRAAGARIAMDDFGQGYSALSYLEKLPIDVLKIDKAFVDRLCKGEPAILTEVVFELGHRLGLEIVAEGIEQAEQVTALRELACRLGQGYLFSPPVPSDVVGSWLAGGLTTFSYKPDGTVALPGGQDAP